MEIHLRPNEIQPGIFLFTSFRYLMVNSTVIDCGETVVVVDTLLRQDEASQINEFIVNELKKPVQWIINTHWHKDHLFGNKAFSAEMTIAHENYIHSEEAKKLTDGHRMPYTHPTITFSERINLKAGLCQFELRAAPGHSPDGLMVYLPDKKIMITGDTVFGKGTRRVNIPYVHEGSWSQLENTLKTMLTYDICLVIPGHARTSDQSLIQEQLNYIQQLRRFVIEASENGLGKEDLLAFPVTDFTPNRLEPMIPKLHEKNIHKMWNEYHQK